MSMKSPDDASALSLNSTSPATESGDTVTTRDHADRIKTSELLEGLPLSDIARAQAVAKRVYVRRWHKVAKRSRYVRSRIQTVFKRMHAPDALQLLPIVESGYNPYAFSSAGAMGLWQLMPGTARYLGMKRSEDINSRRNVVRSTENALQYLQALKKQFHYWPLALAAYHCGPANVARRLRHRPWKPSDGLRRLPAPTITRLYVKQIIGLVSLYQSRSIVFPHPIATRQITLQGPVDLHLLSKAAGLSRTELFRFNPGLNHSLYLHGRFTLHVPEASADDLLAMMDNAVPKHIHIRIHRGDSLWTLARKYGTSVHYLRTINRHHLGKYLHPGRTLLVPARRFARAAPPPNPLLSRGRRILYKVRHGDNLWNIARKFGTTTKAIARANSLHDASSLHPGDRLWILAQL